MLPSWLKNVIGPAQTPVHRCRTFHCTTSPSATRSSCIPHEICPVDSTVVDGHGAMDESYLTGEPYVMI